MHSGSHDDVAVDSLAALLSKQFHERMKEQRFECSYDNSEDISNAELPSDMYVPLSASSRYINGLTSQSLEALKRLPGNLTKTSESLDSQISTLCLRHVHSFLLAHTATSSIPPTLQTIDDSLSHILEHSLPALTHSAESFGLHAAPVVESRSRYRELYDTYTSSLSDLLDFPRMVRSAVKAGYYTEALQLTEYIARLAHPSSNLGGGIVLQTLLEEVWNEIIGMQNVLLSTFERPELKLPEARNSVLHLRKLTELERSTIAEASADIRSTPLPTIGLNESQLCMSFLLSRSKLIRNHRPTFVVNGGSESASAAVCLRKYVDSWREGVSDTCGLAYALFVGKTFPTKHHNSSSAAALAFPSATQQSKTDITISLLLISAFATHHLGQLRVHLEELVPKVTAPLETYYNKDSILDGNSERAYIPVDFEVVASHLADFYTQLSYASISLSRVGVDFFQLLRRPRRLELSEVSLQTDVSIVSSEALKLLTLPIQSSLRTFKCRIGDARKSPGIRRPQVADLLIAASHVDKLLSKPFSSPAPNPSEETDISTSLPTVCSILRPFPSLWTLFESILAGLNCFRLFAPYDVRHLSLTVLDILLDDSLQFLLSLCDVYKGPNTPHAFILSAEAISNLPFPLLPESQAQETQPHLPALDSEQFQTRSEAISCVLVAHCVAAFSFTLIPWARKALWMQVYGTNTDSSDSAAYNHTQNFTTNFAASEPSEALPHIPYKLQAKFDIAQALLEHANTKWLENEQELYDCQKQRWHEQQNQMEQERKKKQKLEQERKEKEKLEQERKEREKLEQESLKKQQEEHEQKFERKKFELQEKHYIEQKRSEQDHKEQQQKEPSMNEDEKVIGSETQPESQLPSTDEAILHSPLTTHSAGDTTQEERKGVLDNAVSKYNGPSTVDGNEISSSAQTPSPHPPAASMPSHPDASTSSPLASSTEPTFASKSEQPVVTPSSQSQAPPPRAPATKLSLADKLRIRAEERERKERAAKAQHETKPSISGQTTSSNDLTVSSEQSLVGSNVGVNSGSHIPTDKNFIGHDSDPVNTGDPHGESSMSHSESNEQPYSQGIASTVQTSYVLAKNNDDSNAKTSESEALELQRDASQGAEHAQEQFSQNIEQEYVQEQKQTQEEKVKVSTEEH